MPAAKLASPYIFQEPHIVKLSDEERISGEVSSTNLGEAIAALHRDGLVVLENAVEMDHVDKLNGILSEEAHVMAKMPTTHFNDVRDRGCLSSSTTVLLTFSQNSASAESTGNMSQGPPLTPYLMFTDIWANKAASAVISNVLGPNPHVNYVNGNTALGGGYKGRQMVHADLTFNHGTFPFAIVANYYLIDVSPANGSTELWLGSHRDTSFRDHRNCKPVDETEDAAKIDTANGGYDKSIESDFGIRPELLEERRAYAPPMQPTVKKGSVVLRDLRLWHAGLPNPTNDPRIMLAFVHTPA